MAEDQVDPRVGNLAASIEALLTRASPVDREILLATGGLSYVCTPDGVLKPDYQDSLRRSVLAGTRRVLPALDQLNAFLQTGPDGLDPWVAYVSGGRWTNLAAFVHDLAISVEKPGSRRARATDEEFRKLVAKAMPAVQKGANLRGEEPPTEAEMFGWSRVANALMGLLAEQLRPVDSGVISRALQDLRLDDEGGADEEEGTQDEEEGTQDEADAQEGAGTPLDLRELLELIGSGPNAFNAAYLKRTLVASADENETMEARAKARANATFTFGDPAEADKIDEAEVERVIAAYNDGCEDGYEDGYAEGYEDAGGDLDDLGEVEEDDEIEDGGQDEDGYDKTEEHKLVDHVKRNFARFIQSAKATVPRAAWLEMLEKAAVALSPEDPMSVLVEVGARISARPTEDTAVHSADFETEPE